MSKPPVETTDLRLSEPVEQPESLRALLQSISVVRKHANLYGFDHPSTPGCIENLSRAIQDFQESLGGASCVFLETGVIVNDRYFAPSVDSLDLWRRLRDRGAMALTFADNLMSDQVQGFLSFLTADPTEVRHTGGPSAYLREKGVSRIGATEAVYPGADESKKENDSACDPSRDADPMVAAALNWLSRYDDDGSESPLLPVVEIVSHPDMVAKLIREAIAKLRESRSGCTDQELATEVIHELKEMAAMDPERWDAATPQIRKAISNLPPEMRPAIGMFQNDSSGTGLSAKLKVVDTDEIERMLSKAFDPQAGPAYGEVTGQALNGLFDITAEGVIASWRRELDPTSFLRSSSNTLESLIAWEQSAPDHARMAVALGNLIPQALDIGDTGTALRFIATLAGEAISQGEQEWRKANAISVLKTLDSQVLRALVCEALKQQDEAASDIAVNILEAIPELSTDMIAMVGSNADARFDEALRKAIMIASRLTLEPLGIQLRRGAPSARATALELLVKIGGSEAAKQIAQAVEGADPGFIIMALNTLSTMRFKVATEACVKALSNRAPEVRAAALACLGRRGDASALTHLMQFASGRLTRRANADERVTAIQTLGQIGNEEAAKWLKQMANRRTFFGRSRNQPLRIAAEQAVAAIGYRKPTIQE